MSNEQTTMSTIGLAVPANLPVGSVVLDRFDRAWQRAGTSWHAAGFPVLFPTTPSQMKWGDLLLHRGPVRVIHLEPEEKA